MILFNRATTNESRACPASTILSQLRARSYQASGPRLEMNEIGLLVRKLQHCGLDYSYTISRQSSAR
jgi:hypothetical protein